MKIVSRHTLSHCSLCESDMVVYADCGNSCCNAGTGEINGKKCGCDEAYDHQTAHIEDPDSIQFTADVRKVVEFKRFPNLAS